MRAANILWFFLFRLVASFTFSSIFLSEHGQTNTDAHKLTYA